MQNNVYAIILSPAFRAYINAANIKRNNNFSKHKENIVIDVLSTQWIYDNDGRSHGERKEI